MRASVIWDFLVKLSPNKLRPRKVSPFGKEICYRSSTARWRTAISDAALIFSPQPRRGVTQHGVAFQAASAKKLTFCGRSPSESIIYRRRATARRAHPQ